MADDPVLLEQHYIIFGHIVSLYARAEVGFRVVLGQMLDLTPEATVLVTASYTSANLRAAVKATAKEVLGSSPAVCERLLWLTGEHQALSRFRNDIAHNTWDRGTTPMAIRPIKADIREGRLKASGYRDNDADYSTEDMTRLQNQAVKLSQSLYELILSEEFEQAIARKTAVSSFFSDSG